MSLPLFLASDLSMCLCINLTCVYGWYTYRVNVTF